MAALGRYAVALATIAIVSACGGASSVAPSSAAFNSGYAGRTLFVDGRPVTAERLNPMPRFATFVPDHHSKKKYEYVFNYYNTYGDVFDYPKSVQQIAKMYGAGGQGCTNVLYGYGKKYFWNVAGASRITEYEVPKTQVKTLSVNYSFASSCAMSAAGDLAIGILKNYNGPGGGYVVIFKKGSGSGTAYATPLAEEFFDGYDNKGNLFADGFTSYRSGFALVELPKGSSKFVTIETSNAVEFPGSVQWDGTYITVFDQETNEFFEYTVSGTKATLQNTIQLTGSADCAQTWIAKGLVFCGDTGNDDGEVFKYPAGGSPIAVFTGNFDLPLGVTAARN